MQSNPYFDCNVDNPQLELASAHAEIAKLTNEIRVLKLSALELKEQVVMEQGRRQEIEQNVHKVINSPGAVSDQLQMWSDKVSVLKQITDLQSTLIDKEFIIRQNDVVKDLRVALDLATPKSATPEESEVDAFEHSSSIITVDEAHPSPEERSPVSSREFSPSPPPKFKRGNTHVVYNSHVIQPADK